MVRRLALGVSLLVACGDDASQVETSSSGSSSTTGPSSTASTSGDAEGSTTETTAVDSTAADTETGGPSSPSGLVWTFEDQAVGGEVADAPLPEGGAVEGSLRFVDGQRKGTVAARSGAGQLRVEDAAEADFGDLSFRVEATVRTPYAGPGGSDANVLVTRGDARGYALLVREGLLVWRAWSEAGTVEVSSAVPVSDDRWHQVTAVRDREAQELVLVVDGYDVARAPDDLGDLSEDGELSVFLPFYGSLDRLALLPGRVDVPAPTPEWDARPLFVGSQEPGYTAFRIPAIVQTEDGTVVAFAEGRVDAECDFGEIHVVSKRSLDGGETWSDLQVVATLGDGKAGNPIPIADGNRIALMVLETPCDTGSGCSCNGAQRHALYLSDDAGQTWSDREEITDDVTREGWGGVLLGPGSGIRLERGPDAGRLVVTAKHGTQSHLLVSDDHGASWSIGAEDTTNPISVNETTAAELSDGRILVNARYQRSLEQQEAEAGQGFRSLGHVATDGSYPDRPTFARTARFPGPVVHGAMLYREGSERLGDATRLLFSFPAGEYGTNAGRRHDLRVYSSFDDGQSWERSRRAFPGWAAYSDLVALEDGRVGVIVEGNGTFGPMLGAYAQIRLLRFAPEWLDHASLATYTFEGESLEGAGGFSLPLSLQGGASFVQGEHDSTALHLEGGAHACTGATRNALDFGQRDSFAIEVSFRTEAHGSGGAVESGALVTKTAVGTTPAWWLRVEDGQVRFLMSQCPGAQINCGLIANVCDSLTSCENAAVSGGAVSDGQWHHVRVVRDAVAEQLVLEIDDEVVATSPASAHGIVINEEPLCVGAFDGGSRAFEGDIDHVRVELVD